MQGFCLKHKYPSCRPPFQTRSRLRILNPLEFIRIPERADQIFHSGIRFVSKRIFAAGNLWTTRYFTPGDFELYLPASCENIALLQKDFYLCREEDIDGEFSTAVSAS